MTTNLKTPVVHLFLAASVLGACGKIGTVGDNIHNNSHTSSIEVPLPDKIKALIAPGKITGSSFGVTPSHCASGVTGTTIEPVAKLVDAAGLAAVKEKLVQGCDYSFVLSFGKLDSSGTKLEKIYLTNDIDGNRALVEAAKTYVPKLAVNIVLRVTAEGKSDLSIDEQAIAVPSDGPPNFDNPTLPLADYDWRVDGQLSDVATFAFTGDSYGSIFYQDVMTHTPPADRDFQGGLSTHAHESLHGLHNVMRNKTQAKDAFFYFEQGKGMYVIEPKGNSKDVKNHIGASFRTLAQINYDTYLVSQANSWSNTLFIFDEWGAYVATTRSAVESKKSGRWDPSQNSDPINGLVDLMYFCSASILSIKNIDPDYLQNNKQFKASFAMIMEESSKWYKEAKKESLWGNSKAWPKMQNFQTAADGAPVRAAVKELMGDAWTLRVLGF
jgi:hypothetical protein